MRTGELKKKLRKAGCYKIREGGNHEIWYSPKTETAFSVGRHDGQEIATGTANKILEGCGAEISPDPTGFSKWQESEPFAFLVNFSNPHLYPHSKTKRSW